MITIGKPYVTVGNEKAYLRAHVRISEDTARIYMEKVSVLRNTAWLTTVDYPPAVWNNEDSSMWFSVQAEYAEYLCSERSDAFVIALFWYGMITGSDIEFEAPMSRSLYDGIMQKLMPALTKGGEKKIRLAGPITSEKIWCEGGVVTGMSCGVDSMYTLHCYDSDDAPGGNRLTHFAYYDCNYLLPRLEPPYDVREIYRSREETFSHIIDHAKIIAEHHGLPLIIMQSDLDEDFYRGGRIYGSMYRFLACTLAMQHLYGTYISSSSGHDTSELEVSLTVPTQHYEGLLCDCCQTETMHYMTSDDVSRPEKLRALADDGDAGQYLAVCYNAGPHGENCGMCYACEKTIIPLDIMGKLEKFRKSFDVDKYYAEREAVFEELIRFSGRPEATSARESVRQILKLSEQEGTEAGRLFIKKYREIAEHPKSPVPDGC